MNGHPHFDKYQHRSKNSLIGEIIRLREQLSIYTPPKVSDVYEAAMQTVQSYYPEFTWELLRCKSRKREIVLPRHVWQYLLFNFTRESSTEIGHKSNRDHSCIFHADDSVRSLDVTDRIFSAKLKRVEEMFKNMLTENAL